MVHSTRQFRLTLNSDALGTVIAFGKSAKPLSERTKAEILDLAIMARESNQKSLISLFEELPTLENLKAMKEHDVLPVLPPAEEPKKNVLNPNDPIIL